MGFLLNYVKYRPLTNMIPKTRSMFCESEFPNSKGWMTLKFMMSAFVKFKETGHGFLR